MKDDSRRVSLAGFSTGVPGLDAVLGSLTGIGVTVWMTVEIIETFGELRFSPHVISFLTDVINLQRYVELEGHLRRFMTVVKMRYGAHSDALRAYEITSDGLVVGAPLERFRELFTGVARRRSPGRRPPEGLGPDEARALALLRCATGATLEQAEKKLGMSRESVARALDRLVRLNYATAAREKKKKTIYRAIERAER
jgi:hypothetical protein